ncbi:4'-phosphopantetheinyl transferase family protein [Bdellovibrio sp. HCB337]|uniref:4'-phosphopantetheinyl transferase family protein n=1 Tax=Bdellovibrio sp. HCB337 TaxID=3394358 RepID=UPI0039A5B48E
MYNAFIAMLVFEYRHPQHQYSLAIYRFKDAFSEAPEGFLSDEELREFSQMTIEKRRSEYLQSRWQLKRLLTELSGVSPEQMDFTKVGEGKPVWAGRADSIDFNLSHSRDYFAIALSEKGLVGVDIEKNRESRNLSQIAKRFFSREELLLIEQEPNPAKQTEYFAKFWSGKEALIKAQGGGVFKHVHDVLIDEASWKIKKLPLEYGSLSLWDLRFFTEIPDYICSVAFKQRTSN